MDTSSIFFRRPFRLAAGLLLALAVAPARGESISSPNGDIIATVSIVDGQLGYSVAMRGAAVVDPSPLGILTEGRNLGQGAVITGSTSSSKNSTFPSRHGVHSTAQNHFNARQLTITQPATGASYRLDFRVYDEGVAFRYELDGHPPATVTGEATGFELPPASHVWHQPCTSSFGGIYHEAEIEKIASGTPIAPPVVVRLPSSSVYLAITQSFLGSFGNPYLFKASGDSNRLLQVAYPKNTDGSICRPSAGPIAFPWHVIVVARDLDALVNCDIVESLAPAPDPALFPEDAAWITPGRSVWDWLSPLPLGSTQNNAMLNSYWASKLGFEYSTLDQGWESWAGRWTPLAEVTAHAKRLGVKVLVCVDAAGLTTSTERRELFAKLKDAGVSGVKVVFYGPDPARSATADRMTLMEDILREAAAFELVVTFYGASKPVGQFRTYPNLMSIKAIPSEQERPAPSLAVSLPFTRFLAGPGDFTPVNLRDTEQTAPGARTPAYELATAINMASPVITFAERSDRMVKSPFAEILRTIPSTWDETRVLPPSEVGETTVMARRSGRTWFIGAMNANTSRSWKMPLNFLPPGAIFQAEIVRDGSSAVEHRLVTHDTVLAVATVGGGGFVARIHPPNPPVSAVPFATAFNPGTGDRFFVHGASVRDSQWIDRAVADVPPTWRWRMGGPGAETLRVSTETRDAYFGGASLRITGKLAGESLLRLFSAQLPVEKDTKLRLVSKRGVPNVASGMKLALAFDDAPETFREFDVGAAPTAGWNTADIDLSAYAGRRITEIALRFQSGEPVADYAIQIGEIVVYDGSITRPDPPSSLRASKQETLDADSVRLWLEWDPSPSPVRFYNVYARRLDGSREWLCASENTTAFVETARRREKETNLEIQVEAVGPDFGVSDPASTRIDLPQLPNLNHLLTGAVIGTSGSWAKNGHTREKAFDGDLETYFDGPHSDNDWTGLDLGVDGQRTVTGIRYSPRRRWAERMLGGIFQGANNADFSDAVLLGTISSVPVEGVFSTLAVNSPERFRYVRYLSPAGGGGNVAELQFYGVDLTGGLSSALTSGGTRVAMQSVQSSGRQEHAELDQAIDGKDTGLAGWIARPNGNETQSLIVRPAKPVQAASFDLVLCFLSGYPGCYPAEFTLSYTTDAEPKLSGGWTQLLPERFTSTGPDLRMVKDGRLATTGAEGATGDAIFQVWMPGPVQPVTGFRVNVFPIHPPGKPGEWSLSWSRTRDVRLTEFRVTANHSTTTNIALGRPVKASHAVWKGTSESALTDGLPGSFVHPADPAVGNAFSFLIDLGLVRQLDHVALRGRADGYGTDRMSRVKLELFDREPGVGTTAAWSIVNRADGSDPEPGAIDILRAADGVGTCRGRYLRISSDSPVSLSPQLAEVEVYGTLTAQIAAVEADGKSLKRGDMLRVPAGTRLLNIAFNIPGANIPDQLPIRWRLEGLHTDWQTTRNLNAQLTDPPAGSYLFEAEVGHTDGEWDSARLNVPIVVERYFWERPTFFVPVAAVAIAAALFAGQRARRRQAARREALRRHKSELAEERTRIARNMHDEVGARLSQIAMMQDLVVRRHPLPDEARDALRELSSNTRRAVDALDQAVWAVNPRHDALSGVVEYLSNTATSYLGPLGISCRLDVPREWPVREVRAQVRHQLVLAFQEALQNVVKHSGATTVTLGIRYEAEALNIRLSDNGRGLQKSPEDTGRDGVANMRARLASIGGDFSIRSGDASGVEVAMRIPL